MDTKGYQRIPKDTKGKLTLIISLIQVLILLAINEINDRKERDIWNIADKCGTKECYQVYLDKYPNGYFSELSSLILSIPSNQWFPTPYSRY